LKNDVIGTAWLSSVCAVECNIKLLNKRNLFNKFLFFLFFKETICLKKKKIFYLKENKLL